MRKLVATVALALAACGGGGGGGGEVATVATPVLSPAAGTYATVQSVTITCATAGATIHYTTDGTPPTAASPTYGGAIAVTTTGTTLKAMATKAGANDSAVASATYVLQVARPVITPAAGTYLTAQEVTIVSATPGAAIHYTTDGTPATPASTVYAGPFTLPVGEVATTTTVKAVGTKAGFEDSAPASSAITIDAAATPAAAPTFDPGGATYTSVQTVTISTATAGASIYYTEDGSTPTTSLTPHASPVVVTVGTSRTLKALASGGGHTPSTVTTQVYTITLPTAATPTFTPGAGSYATAQSVTIASATAGATIHYTEDGSTPTTSLTPHASPVVVTVGTSRTLKAIASRTGYLESDVGTAAYVISGGGSPFLTICTGLFDKVTSLYETCLHANPAVVSTLLGSSTTFCADRQREIDAGLIAYDAASGTACAAAVQGLDCSVLSADRGFVPPAACEASLVGLVPAGGQCRDSVDCATGYCGWDLGAGTCPDTCRDFVALGGACEGPECAPGLVCDGTCKTPGAAGAACPCQEGLHCDTSGATPICRAPLATGAGCDPLGIPCNLLATCAGTPSTCQAWVGLGATCDPLDSLCGLGYECSASSSTCVSWPSTGACTLGCVGGYCDYLAPSATCKALRPNGATCNAAYFGRDCASSVCGAGGTCASDRCALP